MKKTITSLIVSCLLCGTFITSSSAADGWETNIMVASGNAESSLSFGQMSDATDLTDGLYDVPAMLSGGLQAYFQSNEGFFWRDIRAIESETGWQLVVSSQTGYPITITWDPADLPAEGKITMINNSNRHETDMRNSSEYLLENNDETSLLIVVTKN